MFGTTNLLRPANIIKLMLGKLRFPVKIGSNAEIGDYIHIQEFNEWNLRNLVEEVGLTVLNIDYCFWGFQIQITSEPATAQQQRACQRYADESESVSIHLPVTRQQSADKHLEN